MNITTHTIITKCFPALFYRRTGNGPALMLLHGFPATGMLWDGIIPALSTHYTLLIPDLPGAGESRLEGEMLSMDDLASIIPAILDDAGLESCVLAGHSMGGYTAVAAAALFPERLRGLIFVHSTASADDDAKKEKRAKSISLIRKGGKEEFVKGMIPGLFVESFRNEHPEEVTRLKELGMKLPEESMIAFYTAMMNRPDRTGLLGQLKFPVAWVMGADDTTIPWQNTLQQTSSPDVSFVRLYERCGHMSMLEQPQLLSQDLLAFSDYCVKRARET